MSRRFAEDTSVPVSRTQDEIKSRLRQCGAESIAVFESDERSAIAFRLNTAMYRISVPVDPQAKNAAQDQRRAWRLLGLLMKSKLEAVREGATTVEREFLADMLLYDGRTVSEWAAPQIEQANREGRMPTQMLLEGPR
ncbi:hypothetical protein IWC96_14610 [Brevundimonas sp. BAL450]|uniref:hypothetical protein n=1 Tax=Brevundimonas sp. BAL450 TaxID=1708162 RepID=UPI0018CABD9E|nr:hypothetical protein [Brevundimonas sp. BAL450]MBG7616507.1 hypothetical protein [Brevundimonas sp. BAL450]